ncbi:MAG: hypothetical protein AAF740_07320 [Bacteroidota bacterium]
MHHKLIILLVVTQCLFGCQERKNLAMLDLIPSSDQTEEIKERFPILVSEDYGETWKPITKELPADMQASFVEQKENKLVLATDNLTLFMSMADQSKWVSIGDHLPNKKINALHVSGKNIYVGVYRRGIFVTKDEGMTWKPLNYDLQSLDVQSILKLEEQLFIGTDEGVFILEDNMKSWKKTKLDAQVVSLYSYNKRIVARTNQGTSISNNSGENWNWIRQEGAVHYTHNIEERIIELLLNGDVVYSDDWGESWKQTYYEPRAESYVYEIVEAGTYQLMSNNYGILRSSDKGVTWEHIFKTESLVFFDLITIGDKVYGVTRSWDEYRKRRN